MTTSPEFVNLCQAQVGLLAESFGATFSVVYLTQSMGDGHEKHLIPVVVYPESLSRQRLPRFLDTQASLTAERAIVADGLQASDVASGFRKSEEILAPLLEADHTQGQIAPLESPETVASEGQMASGSPAADAFTRSRHQVVLPLMHQQTVLGLLMVGRDDRPWTAWEQTQMEQVATTIAMGCALDQQAQLLEQDRAQHRQLQAQQHDTLDNLLHQFRNSLTALRTFGKLIVRRMQAEDANREIALSVIRETDRLQDLSQEIEWLTTEVDVAPAMPTSLLPAAAITVSSTPTNALGGATLTLEACDLLTVLKPLLASAQPLAQDRQQTIHVAVATHLPAVQGDPQALREVLNNLLENALKYTPIGGHILIEVHPVADQVEIAVSDTGVGIPPQDLPHIFERRFRGIQATGTIPGTGLGLAIAHALITQMQGSIQVVSPARRTEQWQELPLDLQAAIGTTFAVQLPVG